MFDQHTIWVLIPIAAIFAGVLRHSLRLKEKALDRAHERESAMVHRHAAETRRLEERVQVLERIVTDKGLDLSLEIEALRDRPGAPAARPD